MRLRTAELCESVLLFLVRILLPARGRHRATSAPPPPTRSALPLPIAAEEPLLMDTPLVRPYLHATEVFA
ncbi:hypothetical protein [Streptomyces africanus]|uniref:hypothetical protein n=1 Tax=Streptomyces africanus TaxID=231024 RepID=UPI000A382DCE|nr:hypothetical protein [Streptomyces africanus]